MTTKVTRVLEVTGLVMMCFGAFGLSYPPALIPGIGLLAAGIVLHTLPYFHI